MSAATSAKPHDLRERIADAETEADIIRVCNQAGFGHVETHITALHDMIAEDGDEYYVKLESLKKFVPFLIDHPGISTSQVGVVPDGYIDVILDSPDGDTTVIMEFLPDGDILCTTGNGQNDPVQEPHIVCERTSPENILEYLKAACPQGVALVKELER